MADLRSYQVTRNCCSSGNCVVCMARPDFYAVHLKAPQDRNGNGRRCFAIYDAENGTLVGVADEGYSGDRAAEFEVRPADGSETCVCRSCMRGRVSILCRVSVPVSEYLETLALGGAVSGPGHVGEDD